MNVRQVVPRDAIPSVDDPTFGEEYVGDPDDEVIVVERAAGDDETDAPPRAYPVGILNYHEIVNDEFGDPIAVTWCPLCGSAIVYERRVGEEGAVGEDGRVLEFGVSGKLADDDLVMYDRETGTEWKQSLGEAIAGELAGESLRVLPSSVTTYEQFRDRNPRGRVLQRPGGESEASGPGDDPEPIDYDDAPYADYFESDGFGLGAHRGSGGREWDREELAPKAVLLGIESGGDSLGFPLGRVEAAGGVAQATVGDRRVVVFATPEGIHAFENPGYEFEPVTETDGADEADGSDDADGCFRADGARWTGATGESDDGRELTRLPAKRLFAFAWRDDHGADAFWSAE
jgi:hypothetical protein